MKFRVTVAGEEHPLELLSRDADRLQMSLGGSRFDVRILERGASMLILVDGRPLRVHASAGRASCDGLLGTVVDDAVAARAQTGQGPSGLHALAAPMPGRVVSVHCAVGAWVPAGRPLLVLEAMKMENELLAPCDGIVQQIRVAEGIAVEAGTIVVELLAGPAPTEAGA
jgi:biotin carboxyl carrier protein